MLSIPAIMPAYAWVSKAAGVFSYKDGLVCCERKWCDVLVKNAQLIYFDIRSRVEQTGGACNIW
jgi:hypothetical protein